MAVTISPADIDSEYLIDWCLPHDRAGLSPLDAALLDACPVVFDPRQYERAANLGLAGRLASVMFEGVIFDGARFHLAQHCEDQRGAEVAFLLPVHDTESCWSAYQRIAREKAENGEVDAHGLPTVHVGELTNVDIADIVAWVPEIDRAATLLGAVGTLGLWNVRVWQTAPIAVHGNVLGWLLAGGNGLCIVDAEIAADELDGVTLAAPDAAAALKLHSALAPHAMRAPQIVVPKAKAA